MANTAYITYTDAIEALKVLGHEKFRLADDFQPYINALVDACDRIEAIPSADVMEVKHGRWIKTVGENGVTSACRCSNCGFGDNRYSLFNYCPRCGARMDEE